MADIHVWTIGPGVFAAIVSVVSETPRSPEHYKRMIPAELSVVHKTVEVHRRGETPTEPDGDPSSAGEVY